MSNLVEDLSFRDLDVLSLLVKGCANGEIANELHLSIRTVAGQIASLKQKFSVNKRADLIRYIRKHGLS